jgi:DNA-binding PadR family transcriptional regulator
MTSQPKDSQANPIQGLLAFMLLQMLDAQPMREQQIAASIHNAFGIWLEANAIDIVLADLKSQGLIESRTDIVIDEPPETYQLTSKGRNALSEAEGTLVSTCKDLSA